MIKRKETEAFHKACKKLTPQPLEVDPSIDLQPVVRKEKKVKQAESDIKNINKNKDDDNVV